MNTLNLIFIFITIKMYNTELLASSSYDGQVKIYNLSSSQTIFEFTQRGPIISIKSLDKFHLACLSNLKKDITVWSLKTRTVHGQLSHGRSILVMDVFNESILASGGKDSMVILWNWQTLLPIQQFNHTEHVYALLKINDTVLASGGLTIKLWDINTANLLLTISGHSSTHFVGKIFKIDNNRLVSFAYNNTQVWSMSDGKSLASLDVSNFNRSLDIWFASLVQLDNQTIALGTSGENDRLLVWDMKNYNLLHNISNNGNLDTLVKLFDGRLATRLCCGCFVLLNISNNSIENFCQTGSDNVIRLLELPDGSILSSSSGGFLTKNFLPKNTSSILQTHNVGINQIEILSTKISKFTDFTVESLANILDTHDVSDCLLNCSNHGECVLNAQKENFECKCDQNFTGSSCNLDKRVCSKQPCLNSGVCEDVIDYDEYSHKCICKPLYFGSYCEFKVNVCENETCSSHGYCEDNQDQATCKCYELYFGTKCETESYRMTISTYIISTSSILAILIIISFYFIFILSDLCKFRSKTVRKPPVYKKFKYKNFSSSKNI